MQKIRKVKLKRFLENLGAAALVIFTYALSGILTGAAMGLVFGVILTR